MISALFRMVGRYPLPVVRAAAVVLGLLHVLGAWPAGIFFGSSSGVAWADLADQHYKKALAAYDAKDYPRAIREFKSAYSVRQLPRILLNIGQVYRKLGMASTALKFYEHYLRVEPKPSAEIKNEVDRYIAQTRAMLDPPEFVPVNSKSAAAAAAEAVAAAPSEVTAVNTPEPYVDDLEPAMPIPNKGRGRGRGKGQPAETEVGQPVLPATSPIAKPWQPGSADAQPPPGTAVVTSPLLGPVVPPGKQPPADKPFYKKGWFWGLVGGVAASAIIVGAIVGNSQQNPLPATILYPSK